MTFEEWISAYYKIPLDKVNRPVAARSAPMSAWVAGAEAQREHDTKIAEKQAEYYEHNEMYPAYGLNSRASECHQIAAAIRKGGVS